MRDVSRHSEPCESPEVVEEAATPVVAVLLYFDFLLEVAVLVPASLDDGRAEGPALVLESESSATLRP